jgi:hypothetical protein
LSRQADEVRNKYLGSVKPKADDLRKKQQGLFTGPQEVRVKVSANEQYPDKLTAGQASEIVVGKIPSPRSPGLKVHGVRAVLEGPAPRRDQIQALVDKANMERVLQ